MNNLNNILHGFFLAFLVLLTVLFLFNFAQIATLKNNLSSAVGQLSSGDFTGVPQTTQAPVELEGIDREEVEKLIEERLASMQSEPTAAPSTAPAATNAPQDLSTTYIPLGSTGSTTSTDWVSLPDTAAVVDVNTDYGSDAYVQFEAFLRVDYGSGTGFVRLWDDTNKIAVVGSEMSVVNEIDATYLLSPKLEFWNGRNTYKVQIRSLNGAGVHYSSGKIKVSY
jgi:hypothetical protein